MGFVLAWFGLVPGLSLVSLVLSVIGLRRANPSATPPVGRRGQAIGGIVLSVIGIVVWAALFAAATFNY